MKTAFTMIELIFVIVILGILAAVAIPKLTATRDDAKAAKAAANLAIAVKDMGAQYTATADLNVSQLDNTVVRNNYFTITPNADNDEITVAMGNQDGQGWCDEAEVIAIENGSLGVHIFGGSIVSR